MSDPALRAALSFLTRGVVFYGLLYAAWWPVRDTFVGLLARVAGPMLRLLHDPPWITALVPQGESIVFQSFITGLGKDMAAWSGTNLHLFVLVPVALVLATSDRRTLVPGLAVVVPLALVICTAIVVLQLELLMGKFAWEELGLRIHDHEYQQRIEGLNGILYAVGMLALPAYLFLASYVYRWSTNEDPGTRRPARALSTWLALPSAAVVALFGTLSLVSPEAPTQVRDYHTAWQKILQLNPDSTAAQVNVALHLEESGEIDEAIALYRAALRIDQDLVIAHYNLGNALSRRGRHAEATTCYRNALQRNPEHASSHRNLADALSRQGQPCPALEHLEHSVRLRPAFATITGFDRYRSDLRDLCGRTLKVSRNSPGSQ